MVMSWDAHRDVSGVVNFTAEVMNLGGAYGQAALTFKYNSFGGPITLTKSAWLDPGYSWNTTARLERPSDAVLPFDKSKASVTVTASAVQSTEDTSSKVITNTSTQMIVTQSDMGSDWRAVQSREPTIYDDMADYALATYQFGSGEYPDAVMTIAVYRMNTTEAAVAQYDHETAGSTMDSSVTHPAIGDACSFGGGGVSDGATLMIYPDTDQMHSWEANCTGYGVMFVKNNVFCFMFLAFKDAHQFGPADLTEVAQLQASKMV